MSFGLSLFGSRTTFSEAFKRIEQAATNPDQPLAAETTRALWQIAYELDRIASVLEEVHK